MHPLPSRVFFPLASNSRSLVQGAPIATVRERLKVASLMYDEVLLEGSSIAVYSGPMINVILLGDGSRDSWETSRQRSAAAGKSLTLAPENPTLRVEIEITSAWHASFEPLKHELPSR